MSISQLPEDIPRIIAGPMLRHVNKDVVTVWLVTREPDDITLNLIDHTGASIPLNDEENEHIRYCLGKRCYINLVKAYPAKQLLEDKQYAYDLSLICSANETCHNNGKQNSLKDLCPELFHDNQTHLPFSCAHKLTNVLHGSCRKAHFDGDDALARVKEFTQCSLEAKNDKRADMLLLTGDQVYVDDVAGPMLNAIHQSIKLLGLHHETFTDSVLEGSEDLFDHEFSYYQRERLFPEIAQNEALETAFFKGKRKPVFTSVHAHNHLIALNEMIALYLLSWSSRLWPFIKQMPENEIANMLSEKHAQQYQKEQAFVDNFVGALKDVEYAFSRIPTYMIFDDHDVTDDWNLTRAWEEQVYGNAFSKKMVGNALTAYFLCQGLGNPIDKLRPLCDQASKVFTPDGYQHQNAFIDTLFDFDQWHYQLDTSPPVHVLDTRTQRWRSESNKNKPSGLMDWEALCELQHNMLGHDSVIMVSAAPVYGLKFIEAVQKVFTVFGGALIVDAENWMAHRGTASVMLNIFRHVKTPPNFIILSGDVHYSFVYDVKLRFRRNSPKIVQFTCSGFHNRFPDKLLSWFERLNRWFYGHRSPLNIFTKRRNMSVRQRESDKHDANVVNACSVGLLELDRDGREKACKVICADGSEVKFTHQ
ncbi:alkaline phosphatase D family protein [Ningiella sp. W23]|uniref:alkaline phosphatase D family protein n=1 Tax=Ningiella sp. W23 TaxID=3023715 RepID=UPI0037566DF0